MPLYSSRPIGVAGGEIRQVDQAHREIAVVDADRRSASFCRGFNGLPEHVDRRAVWRGQGLFTSGGFEPYGAMLREEYGVTEPHL